MDVLVVGLGNPGEKYALSRHNAGRRVLETFRERFSFPPWESDEKIVALRSRGTMGSRAVELILPETYMNNSGRSVARALSGAASRPEVVVVYDDIDLPLGAVKISHGRGSGGHHGLASVMAELGTGAFARVRVGVAPRDSGGAIDKPHGKDAVQDFLLSPFGPEEMPDVEAVLARASDALVLMVESGTARAMNEINQRAAA